jgi:hypothetical protein
MARDIVRGEIWQYAFTRPDKRRPVLVLSRQDVIGLLHTVMVAPVTSTIRGAPSEGPNALYRLVVAPTTSGTPQRELARTSAGEEFMLGGGIEGTAWSTDGRFVYYAKQLAPGRDFEVFRVPGSGGAEQRLGLAGADVRELSISPDGSRIAFAMGPLSRPEIWAVQNVSSAK